MKTKLILLFLGIFCSLGALAQVSSITDGGYYYIRLKSNTDYCAQIPSTAGGAVIKSNTQWSIIKLKKTAEGYYTIQDANSGMFANLSAAGDVESTTAKDVRIISSTSAYSWYFEYNSEGGYWQIKATSESVRFWDSWNSASYPSSIPIALLSNNNNNKWQIVEIPFPEKEIAHKTAKAWPYVIQGFEGLATSTSQFSSNSVITWEGGGFDALLDNDVSTYCMTDWYYATSGDPYYIVTIAEPIKEFYLSYTTPPNANNTPITWVLEGYNENSDTWVEQTVDFGDIPSEANKVYISDKITLNNSYSKLRFTVTANQGNGKKGDGYTYFGLSEMYLFPVNDHVDAAVARLKELPAAIDLTNEDISEINDIDQSIRNAKLALWKNDIIDRAGASTDENFDKIGWPTTAAYTTFYNTINNLTIEDDYETVGAAALTTLWDAIIYPPTGYYYIHNLGTGRYAFSDETISSNQDFTNDEARSSKYIWKVTLDGTNVKVYSLTGHGITLNNNGGEQKGNLALETPDANSYITARGAFYMGCIQDPNQNSFTYAETSYISASNPMKLTYYNGDRNNSKAYWLFEPVNESTYDVYTVNMVNSPADNYVIYTGSSTTGNKKVYDGGQYFMTKDASVVAGEFTPEDVAGYEVDVSISSKTIIVTYTVTDYEALITAYFDTDKQRNLANAGKIGYMQNTGANFASLSELVASFANPSHVYTADDYNNLIIYYEACAANPILPEVGKYYLIKNKVNGKYMHVTAC